MTATGVPGQDPAPGDPPWPRGEYLSDLHKTAVYAVSRGMLPLLVPHIRFLVKFTNAWLETEKGTEKGEEGKKEGKQDRAGRAAAALMDGWPRWTRWTRRPIANWLVSRKLPNGAVLVLVLLPYIVSLAVVVPAQIGWSVLKSFWDVVRRGVRGVPPLITAVVVVFVTGDAWRILGTGFTVRFRVLVAVFLLSSLLFLVRWTCWDDIDLTEPQAKELLAGLRRTNLDRFNKLVDRGAGPAPMVRPAIPGTIWVYASYWLLCAFALVITALFVSAVLIIIGVILISTSETMTLASSVHVYQTLPGGAVITKQLLSLSFSLGAFAAFFLVAAQRPSDRKAFMKHTLRRFRRDLIVYSIYCRAHDRDAEWSGVCAGVRPLDHPPRPKGWFRGVIRRCLRNARRGRLLRP